MNLPINQIVQGDTLAVLKTLPSESVDMVITSPPYYGLRDYGVDGQIGLEKTFEEYLSKMMVIFAEVKRVLKSSGSFWLNMGDCYGSHRDWTYSDMKGKLSYAEGQKQKATSEKCMLMQPERMAVKMIDDDGDDTYELKKDLTQETILAIMSEINRYGYKNKKTSKTIQNPMGEGMGKEEPRKEKSTMEEVSGKTP